jgi:transposase InsO family protein
LDYQEADPDLSSVKKHLTKFGDVWYYKNRLFIPRELRDRVMKSFHGGHDGGHLGMEKLISVISKSCYWPKMQGSIREFVNQCVPCALSKPPSRKEQVPMGKLPSVSYPFQRIAMDFTGPFPISKEGNQYLLVAIDHFSRYVYIQPSRGATSMDSVRLLKKICNMEGTPEEVITDNGTHFAASFSEFCSSRRIRHVHTSPHHPQSNGAAERFMRTIKGFIRADLLQRSDMTQTSWDTNLETIVANFNQAISSSTGVPPFEVVRGRTLQCGGQLSWLKIPRKRSTQVTLDWMNLSSDQRAKTNEEEVPDTRVMKTFEVGDLVKRTCFQQMKGRSRSLQPKFDGPFIIKRRISDVNYEIGLPNQTRNFSQILHVQHLFPFAPSTPTMVFHPRRVGRPSREGGV